MKSILFLNIKNNQFRVFKQLLRYHYPEANIQTSEYFTFDGINHLSKTIVCHIAQFELITINCTDLPKETIDEIERIRLIHPRHIITINLNVTENIKDQQNHNSTSNISKTFPSISHALGRNAPSDEQDLFFTKLREILELRHALKNQPIDIQNWHPQKLVHSSPNSLLLLATRGPLNDTNPMEHLQGVIKVFAHPIKAKTPLNKKAFMDAINKLRTIKIPSIVKIFSAGINHGEFYIIMEYLGNKTLKHHIESLNSVNIEKELEHFESILNAINALHQTGLMHRDIKPANIMFRQDGSLTLVDCGIENNWLIDGGHLEEEEVFCTPHYVSPERAASEPCSVQSEIYSLGVLFYEMLTKFKPYDGNSILDLIKAHALAPIPKLPKDAFYLQDFMEKMLAKHPDDRYQSIDEALAALNASKNHYI